MKRPLLGALYALTFTISPVCAQKTAASPEPIPIAELENRYRLPQSKFVDLLGTRIHYVDVGSGPVLVLTHGSSSSLRTFVPMIERLSRRYRVIAWDEPNMGLSGAPPQSLYDRPLYPVLVLEALLDRLKVARASLAGVSSGGAISFYYAARNPARVERLILSNTPTGRADGKGMALSTALARELAASTPASGRKSKIFRPRSYWRAYFDFYTGEPERADDRLVDEYYDMNRRPAAPDRLAIVEALDDPTLTADALAKITAPVLLVWGARDPVLPVESAAVLRDVLSHAQVSTLILPDVGHYPPLEVPGRFADILDSFLFDVTPYRPVAPDPAKR
ncbi:MAG: alpha/beta hydrolase [Sphingopyxis sp.]|nr:alpha/beta hydrolase [Sphingopyxis sp.]